MSDLGDMGGQGHDFAVPPSSPELPPILPRADAGLHTQLGDPAAGPTYRPMAATLGHEDEGCGSPAQWALSSVPPGTRCSCHRRTSRATSPRASSQPTRPGSLGRRPGRDHGRPAPDSGTCWEVGYAFGTKKSIVLVRTDFRALAGDAGEDSPMLTQAATIRLDLPAASTTEVVSAIREALARIEAGSGPEASGH